MPLGGTATVSGGGPGATAGKDKVSGAARWAGTGAGATTAGCCWGVLCGPGWISVDDAGSAGRSAGVDTAAGPKLGAMALSHSGLNMAMAARATPPASSQSNSNPIKALMRLVVRETPATGGGVAGWRRGAFAGPG